MSAYIGKRLSSTAAASAAAAAREATKSGSPPAVLSIPSTVRHGPTSLRTPTTPPDHATAGAAVRHVGCTRRIFLLRPHLTSDELSGLAYRVATLGKNDGINSVLIATSDDDDADTLAFPTSAVDSERTNLSYVDYGAKTGYGRVFHVAGGYDARAVFASGMHGRPEELSTLLDGVRSLALATRGGVERSDETDEVLFRSRVPVITMPHGLVNDGGYALCMASYVLATRDTCYRILNPYRGLAFDPVGLSYVLPRLGREYGQPAAKYPCGLMMALTSYEADAPDMIETGLATHYVEAPSKLGTIERSLGEIVPWKQQGLLKPRARRYGERLPGSIALDDYDDERSDDVNARFRNVAVANLVHSVSVYDAAGQEEDDPSDEREFLGSKYDDPSLFLGGKRESFYGDRSSTLVNVAATFKEIFDEGTVEGIMEGLRIVANSDVRDEGEREGVEVAASFLKDMESQCPLALKAVYRLMQLGSARGESVESCMDREKVVQMNLFCGRDYRTWAESGLDEGEFRSWKHRSIKDVTNDEVLELFQA